MKSMLNEIKLINVREWQNKGRTKKLRMINFHWKLYTTGACGSFRLVAVFCYFISFDKLSILHCLRVYLHFDQIRNTNCLQYPSKASTWTTVLLLASEIFNFLLFNVFLWCIISASPYSNNNQVETFISVFSLKRNFIVIQLAYSNSKHVCSKYRMQKAEKRWCLNKFADSTLCTLPPKSMRTLP